MGRMREEHTKIESGGWHASFFTDQQGVMEKVLSYPFLNLGPVLSGFDYIITIEIQTSCCCRANMARTRQSRPWLSVKMSIKPLKMVSLRSEEVTLRAAHQDRERGLARQQGIMEKVHSSLTVIT